MKTESEQLKELDLLVETAIVDVKKAAQELLEAREEIGRLKRLTAFSCHECGAYFEGERQFDAHVSRSNHNPRVTYP